MTLSSASEVRRCRPLLGTYVEITASGLEESRLHQALNAAYAAIEEIQNRLSAHSDDSELSLLNRTAADGPVKASAETFEILRRAHCLAVKSDGAFDYTVAPRLAQWGLLPGALKRKNAGDWRKVCLLPGRKVRFLGPLALDLGGIAKGMAVDKAVEVLCEWGVTSAVVNAGGDLRAFGPQPITVHLRHPLRPQAFVRTVQLQKAALATSSPCFTERAWRGRRVSHLVNSTNGQPVTGGVTVSVRAPECWMADALTKVVLNDPHRAESLLLEYQAEAFAFTA